MLCGNFELIVIKISSVENYLKHDIIANSLQCSLNDKQS